MTTNELKAKIAAILTTALETEPAFFPETMAYLAIGGSNQEWQAIREVMTGSNMITITGHTIRLTNAGRELARKIDALQKEAAQKRAAAEAPHRTPELESYREECKARLASSRETAIATKHPADIAAYRENMAELAQVKENAAAYETEAPPNPKIEGEMFFRAEPNTHGITHVRPANTGMAYGLTTDGKIALIDNPSGTCEIRGILAVCDSLAEARGEFFKRQYAARCGGTISR